MFQLISVSRDQLDITVVDYCQTKEEAKNAMVQDMIQSTSYESL